MFTGIIRHLGTIVDLKRQPEAIELRIGSAMSNDLDPGDSVAVNGVCLTVLAAEATEWSARLMAETLRRTNLGDLKIEAVVNLERPLKSTQSIDGHFVMGHVDEISRVIDIMVVGDDKVFEFQLPDQMRQYVIPKGSVALDGVSLTVVDVKDHSFTVSMMPYTLKHTIFGSVEVGYKTNLEVDVLGKYVEAFLRRHMINSQSFNVKEALG